jgi:hypothetical protein
LAHQRRRFDGPDVRLRGFLVSTALGGQWLDGNGSEPW